MAKGKDVDRSKMRTETHKRKDGRYVTETTREIGYGYCDGNKLSLSDLTITFEVGGN
ncbi:hypothetical protein KY289_011776 [Solanum tuberosum]|nr:hypothetical protein KY289_011776 [Solanum tuberosum]